jgi:hypothetical protein
MRQKIDMVHDPDMATLMQRARRACEELATVGDEVAITRTETQRLLAIARQAPPVDIRITAQDAAPPIIEQLPDDDPHDLALETLRMMRELLNEFPAEWQVKIVKAITARTMLVVAAQLRSTPLTPSA